MSTKYISVASQKGGVGKSTFTILLASILHYERGYNVAVVDCNGPQFTVYKKREREKDQVISNPYFKAMFKDQDERLKKKPYPIFRCDVKDNILDSASKVLNQFSMTYDYVFFDFPGYIDSKELVKAIIGMDYLFIPMEADEEVLYPTIDFADIMNKTFKKSGKEDNVFVFWNKVDKREKNDLYELFDKEVFKPNNLRVMKHYFPLSSKFKKRINEDAKTIFRSTLFPSMKAAIKGTNINLDGFVDEFLSKINKSSDHEHDQNRVQDEVFEEAV